MSIPLEILNIVMVAGAGLIIGIVLNSKNTIGVINATANLFATAFGAAAATIR